MNLATSTRNADKGPAQNIEDETQLQRLGNQKAMATGQPPNAMSRPAGMQLSFSLILPIIRPQLDKDKAMQLQGLYARLRLNAKPRMDNKSQKRRFLEHQSDSHGVQASHKSSDVNAIKQERDKPFPMEGHGNESSKDETFEMMSSKPPGFSNSMNKPEPMSITAQMERLNVSAGNSSLASGSNAKTLLSKKQKVYGALSDQQLNDVTVVSGGAS